MILTDEDHQALTSNGLEPFKVRTKKTVNQMFQYFKERCCSMAHLFYSDPLKHRDFFYLDNRVMSDLKNHWVKGLHIHLINDLWFKNIKVDEA